MTYDAYPHYHHTYPYSNIYATYRPLCYCGRLVKDWYGAGRINRGYPYDSNRQGDIETNYRDHGGEPFVININNAAQRNHTFRTAIWTGQHIQVTLMSIDVNEDIGLEVHHDVDQFLRIEAGQGLVQMGENKKNVYFTRTVSDDAAIMVPAGTWHNITNTGRIPLKLYSIYAPPEHPFGTVHKTKAEDIASEHS